jgi:hypothetical protein
LFASRKFVTTFALIAKLTFCGRSSVILKTAITFSLPSSSPPAGSGGGEQFEGSAHGFAAGGAAACEHFLVSVPKRELARGAPNILTPAVRHLRSPLARKNKL